MDKRKKVDTGFSWLLPRMVFFLFIIFSAISLTAQKVDSSFRNYLYDSRVAYFNQLPVVKGCSIFWGDSITQWGDWAEFFQQRKILNRGIAGDNSYGLKARMDEVIKHRPSRLFIMIGTNDINKMISAELVIRNYREIINSIQKNSPSTRIFIQSVLPINNKLIGRQYYSGTNEQIIDLNSSIKKLAMETGVQYLDLFSVLKDNEEQLTERYTYDGLHLSAAGYLAWVNFLRKKKLI